MKATLIALLIAAAVLLMGTRGDPDACERALLAADRIVAASDATWSTASMEVTKVHEAVDNSGYKRLAAECRQ